MPSTLTFEALRAANRDRLPQFKAATGEPAHSMPDGSDWSINDWLTAVVGEVGELANMLKKVRRGDYPLAQVQQEIADELADIATYLDILAYRLGVDLGPAVADKFNRVSERVGATTRLVPTPDLEVDERLRYELQKKELLRVQADIPRMRRMLVACKEQFLLYTESHKAKKTEEGDAKAEVNRTFAERIDAAIAGREYVAAGSEPAAPNRTMGE
jgi:NTP pyrophosphatase (non-canonical NTP hydrolase)